MRWIPILLTLLSTPALVNAVESGSTVAWTYETLQQVRKGNAENGNKLAGSCAGCHGVRGEGTNVEIRDDESLPAIPAIAGQNPYYMYKQLRDYANDDRSHDSMSGIAKGLSEQDAADLAAWFSSLALPIQKDEGKDFSAAQKMISTGDGKRILPPCSVCHGANGQGDKIDIPSLAGQRADYFEKTLLAYRDGQRHNDIYSRMRLIAKQLSVDEIKALSIYYQQLK
ncbi:MAG: c-type cytochrome [Methyloglobulus sp.]|nr:c-type cytochrome [Methyloglobulus sp.]